MVANSPASWPASERVVLDNISWETYQRLLQEVGNRAIRMNYDEGALEITSPLPIHERSKRLLAWMVEMLAMEFGLPFASLGSTTFFRPDVEKGLEPDECYYIQHEPVGRALERGDLSSQLPPDLAIEIDITRSSVARQPIYASLGVPELWRWDGQGLQALKLTDRGVYQAIEHSRSLPRLRVVELEPFLKRLGKEAENTIRRDFQRWVRERFGGG